MISRLSSCGAFASKTFETNKEKKKKDSYQCTSEAAVVLTGYESSTLVKEK